MVVQSLESAFTSVPSEMRDAAREALLRFAETLFVIDERWRELGTDARTTWLDAATCAFVRTPDDLRRTLGHVCAVVGFLDNWSDCATSSKWRTYQAEQFEANENVDTGVVWAANKAGEAAREALHAIVDHLRVATQIKASS